MHVKEVLSTVFDKFILAPDLVLLSIQYKLVVVHTYTDSGPVGTLCLCIERENVNKWSTQERGSVSLRVPLQNKLTFLARTASVCALGICVLCKQDVILSNHKSSCNSSQQHERKLCGCVCEVEKKRLDGRQAGSLGPSVQVNSNKALLLVITSFELYLLNYVSNFYTGIFSDLSSPQLFISIFPSSHPVAFLQIVFQYSFKHQHFFFSACSFLVIISVFLFLERPSR